METQYANWKAALERLWSAASPDWREAARLIADIANAGEDDVLRQAAAQALPVVRHASASRAGRLAAPRFGKRGAAKALTPEQHCRQMLGLPLDRRLTPVEIHQAFKRAAKTLHPDAGGDGRAFLELAAARDTLMQAPNKKGG